MVSDIISILERAWALVIVGGLLLCIVGLGIEIVNYILGMI